MNKLFLSIVILISFLTSQSFALVCQSSCAMPLNTIEKDASEMPDCHSSQKEEAPSKETHSCSKMCQTDILESQVQHLTRDSISIDNDKLQAWNPTAVSFSITHQKFEGSFDINSPPISPSLPIFIVQEKYLI